MKSETKRALIVGIISVLIVAIFLFVYSLMTKKEEEYDHLKNYKVNEYIPTYVSDEDMAKIYLNDYLYYARYDSLKSYELLNEEYRTKKFVDYTDYLNYINNFINQNIKLEEYSKTNKKGYTVYKIYDNIGNVFIVKTKGVMQYTIYFDEDTVEIW